MKANWKRGLTRTWMVGSVVWFVFAAWTVEPILYKDFHLTPGRDAFDAALVNAKKTYQPTDTGWPLWESCTKDDSEAVPSVRFCPQAGELGKVSKDVHWTIEVTTAEFGREQFSAIPYDGDLNKVYPAIKKVYFDRHWSQTENDLWLGVAIVFVPPIGALLVGLALWWILAGFRSTQLS